MKSQTTLGQAASVMGAEATTSVFVSYSRSDRSRVTGLGLLLEALGHRIFIDHKTIKPGVRWEARLQQGLDDARVLLVFWTKRARDSRWVRQEIEYFHVHFPDRPIVPVLGDETDLSDLLATYQHSDFCPLINELLDLKRRMKAEQRATPGQIQKAIIARLEEAGIEIDEKDRRKVLALFAPAGLAGLFAAPLVFLEQLGNAGIEAIAQLSAAQLGLLGVAAVSGAVVCGIADHATGGGSLRITDIEYPGTIVSDTPGSNITVTLAGSPALPLEMIFRPKSCQDGRTCNTLRGEFLTLPEDSRLTGEGWLYCRGVQQTWDMDYEIVLRDSTGAAVARDTPAQCVPRPVPGGLYRD